MFPIKSSVSLGFGDVCSVCHRVDGAITRPERGLGASSLSILGLSMIRRGGALVLARVAQTPSGAVMPQYLTCCSCRC